MSLRPLQLEAIRRRARPCGSRPCASPGARLAARAGQRPSARCRCGRVDAVADEIDDLRAQVADDLFAGFEASAFPESTIAIIGTATLAYERGIDIGEAFSLAIRDALFEQGQAIGRPDVLAAIAADHGVTVADDATARTAAEADLAEGKTRGVVGSPYFIVDGHEFFCPTLDIQRRGEHLHIAIDHNAFSGFIEHALV